MELVLLGFVIGTSGSGIVWYLFDNGKADLRAEIAALKNEKADLQARLKAALATTKSKL
jgi:hypothetical protein